MKKVGAIFLSLLFLMPTVAFSAQKKLSEWWVKKDAVQKYAMLLLDVQSLLQVNFAEVYKEFPVKDFGFRWRGLPKSRTKDGVEWGVKIFAVMKDSPAAKAGIKAGDWLMSVQGVSCNMALFPNGMIDELSRKNVLTFHKCTFDLYEKLRDTEEIFLGVERDGKIFSFLVKKAEIGQKIAVFFEQNESAWHRSWDEGQKRLTDILYEELLEINAGTLDGQKLDELWLEVREVKEKMFAGLHDLNRFEYSLWEKSK